MFMLPLDVSPPDLKVVYGIYFFGNMK